LWLLGTAPKPQGEGALPGKNLKAAMQKYRDALARARWNAAYGSLGALYKEARTMGIDRTPVLAAETKDFLEKATPAQKQRFTDDLQGLRFSTPDAPPLPDIPFYLELNKISREKESERFFNLIQGLYSKTFTHAYEDPKGCIRLGKDQAVGVAQKVKKAEAKLTHYKSFLDQEREAVVKALLTTCACGVAADSTREIQDYMKAFPTDPALPKLKDQLDKIAAGDPSLRFSCSLEGPPSPPAP
jgi:hypothetical protein